MRARPTHIEWKWLTRIALVSLAASTGIACDGGAAGGNGSGHGQPGSRGGRPGGGDRPAAAVPVEVQPVERRTIASYLETNGAIEAENDVDIVARAAGPVVELAAEEGMFVKKGQLLARIDETELRAQVEIARVKVKDAERNHARAISSHENQLISDEAFEQIVSDRESAEAELVGRNILLDYTRIVAPFSGFIAERAVRLGENITVNQRLFRISDFDPLLCRIQVPEKELSRLRLRQPGYLTVEAWPEERFDAKILRISPVVEPASGTIRVTLEVSRRGKLRPGMFANVFVEVDRREDALVIPKKALSLESLGDTVYIAAGDTAARRPVELGYEDADHVEVRSGVEEGDPVIIVGQDGLSDGTPIRILSRSGDTAGTAPADAGSEARPPDSRRGDPGGEGGPPSPERLERLKQRMREQGLSDEEIEKRIKERREQRGQGH